jgi:hypothetical protein
MIASVCLDAFSSVVTLLVAQPDSRTSIAAQNSALHASARSPPVGQECGAPIPDCRATRGAIVGGKFGAMWVRMIFPWRAWC